MRIAFSKAAVKALKDSRYENLYINIARMRDGHWVICWYPQFLGAHRFVDAIRLRALWLAHLNDQTTPGFWKPHMLKTIKVL